MFGDKSFVRKFLGKEITSEKFYHKLGQKKFLIKKFLVKKKWENFPSFTMFELGLPQG